MKAVKSDIIHLIPAGTRVRCSKVSTENGEEAVLPDGYWLEGTMFADLEVDRPIKVVRSRRARQFPDEPKVVDCAGMFVSTPIQKIVDEGNGGALVKTVNSRWRISKL